MNSLIRCQWVYSDVINYAMQQNHVPIVKQLALFNVSDEDFSQITLRLLAETGFAYEWSRTIDTLSAGQSIDLGAVPLQMSASFLAGLTERMTSTLTLSVSQGETILYEERAQIVVLAGDEWGGLAVLPELTAAFVTPNHPQIIEVVRDASDILHRWKGSPSFTAYQSKDSRRVREQVAALYQAIQQKGIAYCVAPPSFEQIGQRVRLPDTLFTHRIGNCFDLSLLFAACMEAVGLHPLIIFIEGHAFVGVWLVEDTFTESVQDDISLLTKRMASGIDAICVMEATSMVKGASTKFDEAVSIAASHLSNPDQFDCLVDIRRARSASIRPLPIRVDIDKENVQETMAEPLFLTADTSTAPQSFEVLEKPEEVDAIPISKQKQWERRLLDLSLRNTLINFRMTKSSVKILLTQLGELEDCIADREEFQVLAMPSDWQGNERSVSLYQNIKHNHPLTKLLNDEFERKRLRADLNEHELDRRMIQLYRSARLSLEENGANTLYLALGILKWYESSASEMPRYAPLVLVPIQILKKTSRSGYIIRGIEEDPQINITLLELLRQDYGISIGGLDPLPRDDKGVHLSQIFTTIRHAIMQESRWDVEEEAYLGLFSFGQFVMWNDIRMRSSELTANPIVASLMEGKLRWQQPSDLEDGSLDDEHPSKLFVPISADSSQLAAISAAMSGQSFVLHGPPGTGKSQTITNMIAGALASGKRVLFVAEKMAALSVVQKRLESIGLGSFCLELHSNKSTKKAVLDQFQAVIESPRVQTPDGWNNQADRLAKLRQELNGYSSALHHKYAFGFSLYEAIAGYERAGKGADHVVFDRHTAADLTAEKVDQWRDLAARLKAASAQCGNPAGHAWSDARSSVYSQGMKEDVERTLKSYIALQEPIETALGNALLQFRMEPATLHYDNVSRLSQLCSHMMLMPDFQPALLQLPNIKEVSDRLLKVAEQGRRRDRIRQSVHAVFGPEISRLDAAFTLSEWMKSELKWAVPKFFGQKRIVKLLGTMVVPGQAIMKESVPTFLGDIISLQEEERKLKEIWQSASQIAETAGWNDLLDDWELIGSSARWVTELHSLFALWYSQENAAAEACERIGEYMAQGKSNVDKQQEVFSQTMILRDKAITCEVQLRDMLQLDWNGLVDAAAGTSWHLFMKKKAELWENHINGLRDWCSWRREREIAEAEGLSPLIQPHEQGSLLESEMILAFERGLYKASANYIFDHDERLGAFSGQLFEDKIKRFRETDNRFEQLTRQEIAARLSARVPQMTQEAAQSSEAGILQRAIRSGGRAMSIRKLMDQIPNLLPRLMPCMLMSPLSVAQYLDPKSAQFDLVIFDEASQVPTAQAVGALARGRQAVIVGDPKQLPPTSFFSKSYDEVDEESQLLQDMESILDDCLALGMYQRHLSWHYRSRHESLIAFSNAHYYENKLMTFPSPDEPVSSVSWRPTGGYYDRGRTKRNMAEGEAVVAEIINRLKDSSLRNQSIGVVTFSSIQQSLIEDLLDDAMRKEPELEVFLSQLPEPIFVKNLENVQGDERDIILFSIGYGPDAGGKVSLNFGPLNRQGGWRRLNVAVSRARYEMIVFSTLHAHHLSASRTSSEGVLGLKAFLEYAEKGKNTLPVAESAAKLTTLSDVHRSLLHELTELGYQADLYVGASGYRIDAAIRDKHLSNQYRLGVLLDGPIYASAKTARDRDYLRIQVLEQLGWSLHRIWMPDWWENREAELRKIESAMVNAGKEESKIISRKKTSDRFLVAMPVIGQASGNREEEQTSAHRGIENVTVYEVCQLSRMGISDTESFFIDSNSKKIVEQLQQVINEEGPISRSLLAKRVLQAWGISRMGARLERRFDELLYRTKVTHEKTEMDGNVFYWPEGMKPTEYRLFRNAQTEMQRRLAEDLPAEEVANAVKAVLMAQISLPEEDLIRQVTRLLGYARSGTGLNKAIRNGIACAIERNDAVVQNERLVLNQI
ncbi:DUF3320 domain-containing protein [Paenibacillus sp. YIM B09110]|uniref:DUF3320 domain-containing protein n=1 Tax=Paenibacillus sp. YIM B09110 TaxID=3126102 RepID=UPI00301D4636